MTSSRRILYLDPFSGISGDMFVGALLDLGVDLARLTHEISKLGLGGYHLSSKRVFRGAMSAIKFDVEIAGETQKEFDAKPGEFHSHEHAEHCHSHSHEDGGHEHSHASSGTPVKPTSMRRSFREIQELIEKSPLSARVKTSSIAAFEKLAQAEGRIHNMPPAEVTFHEVGALDSIIDFVSVCAGLEMLGVDEVWCGPVALGSGGFVKCDHGLMPVPAPATLELAKGMLLRNTPVESELTTPTGAALVASLAKEFHSVPPMRIEKIGYGAGSREKQAVPNVLRAMLGHADQPREDETIVEIRANIDDATPETIAYLSECLFAAGALDVFSSPIQMKKNRAATMVTVLAERSALDIMAGIFFKESPTFGIRYDFPARMTLQRETISVETCHGKVRVKVGRWKGEVRSAHPEYEDCKALAQSTGAALRDVIQEAHAQAAALRKI